MSRPAAIPTQRQIADAIGGTPALVTRYKKRGMPVDSIRAAVEWKAQNVGARVTLGVPAGAAAGSDAKVLSYEAARALREAAEARIASLRLEEMKGQLIRVDAVRLQLASALASMRESLLQIPARLATVLASETDARKCHDLVNEEVIRALELVVTASNSLSGPAQ